MLEIRSYQPKDYSELEKLYKDSGWFDTETDSEDRIRNQIEKESESILVVTDDDKIIGTTTLLFTERLGLFFRLVAENKEARNNLLEKGESIFKSRGYKEIHILAQEENTNQHEAYEQYGFTKGRLFRWFWKKIM